MNTESLNSSGDYWTNFFEVAAEQGNKSIESSSTSSSSPSSVVNRTQELSLLIPSSNRQASHSINLSPRLISPDHEQPSSSSSLSYTTMPASQLPPASSMIQQQGSSKKKTVVRNFAAVPASQLLPRSLLQSSQKPPKIKKENNEEASKAIIEKSDAEECEADSTSKKRKRKKELDPDYVPENEKIAKSEISPDELRKLSSRKATQRYRAKGLAERQRLEQINSELQQQVTALRGALTHSQKILDVDQQIFDEWERNFNGYNNHFSLKSSEAVWINNPDLSSAENARMSQATRIISLANSIMKDHTMLRRRTDQPSS